MGYPSNTLDYFITILLVKNSERNVADRGLSHVFSEENKEMFYQELG